MSRLEIGQVNVGCEIINSYMTARFRMMRPTAEKRQLRFLFVRCWLIFFLSLYVILHVVKYDGLLFIAQQMLHSLWNLSLILVIMSDWRLCVNGFCFALLQSFFLFTVSPELV